MVAQTLAAKLAVALTASQIFLQPYEAKMKFDPAKDHDTVVKVMNAGCKYFYDYAMAHDPDGDIKARFNMDNDNDPSKPSPKRLLTQMARDPDFAQVLDAYNLFCKNTSGSLDHELVEAVVAFYNEALTDLPPAESMKDLKLPVTSIATDSEGRPIGEVYQEHRRDWVSLKNIPVLMQNAFIAAEDKTFRTHFGVEEAGILRAAMSGGKVGGSTITQQLIKNALLNNKVEERRKIREMVLASQIERRHILDKDRILELYLNKIYFGHSVYGVNTASHLYFNKELKDLNTLQIARLVALAKCPNTCAPDYQAPAGKTNPGPGRVKYVLKRMLDDKLINQEQFDAAVADIPNVQPIQPQSPPSYLVERLNDVDMIKTQFGIDPSQDGGTFKTTMNSRFQADAEADLQEGLAQYEIDFGRARLPKAEGNLKTAIDALQTNPGGQQTWQTALQQFKAPLYDVHWPLAVVLDSSLTKVGLADGRVLNLYRFKNWNPKSGPINLRQYDVVYVSLKKGKQGVVAELRFRPLVQGGALVLDNNGAVRAMVGGFSHGLSPLNHVYTTRHPGSTIKPVVYLAALAAGVQPTSYEQNQPYPIWTEGKWYSPQNYDGAYSNNPETTLHGALINSYNEVAMSLMGQIVPNDNEASLDRVLQFIKAAKIKEDLSKDRHFPTVIGAFDVSMISMARWFATIANLGRRPMVHLVESITQNGQTYNFQNPDPKDPQQMFPADLADDAAFFQLRTMMQDVPVNGTAAALKGRLADLLPRGHNIGEYLGVKTGTSTQWRDSWMIGFTRDLTIAVWVGYDGGEGHEDEPQTLGKGADGAHVAGPIFAEILRHSTKYYPLKPLPGPTQSIASKVEPVQTAEGVIDYVRVGYENRQSTYVSRYNQNQQMGQPYEDYEPRYRSQPYDSQWSYDQQEPGMARQQPRVQRPQVFNPFAQFFGNNGWAQQPDYEDDDAPPRPQRPIPQRGRPGQPMNIRPYDPYGRYYEN